MKFQTTGEYLQEQLAKARKHPLIINGEEWLRVPRLVAAILLVDGNLQPSEVLDSYNVSEVNLN